MSDNISKIDIELHDLAAAFSLLTRLPVPVDHDRAGARAAAAVWAYPLVGAIVGALAGAFGTTLLWFGVPAGIASAGVIGVAMLLTGALHEDGIADCADGLGGGSSRDRALEIMKDSRIGAYGAAALAIVLLARWSGVQGTLGSLNLWAFAAFGAASRVPMVLAMYALPLARNTGLAAGVGRPALAPVLLACVLAAVICLLALGSAGLGVLFWAVVIPLPLFILALRKIGGYTGDILGGSQQLAEIAAMAAVLASVG